MLQFSCIKQGNLFIQNSENLFAPLQMSLKQNKTKIEPEQ